MKHLFKILAMGLGYLVLILLLFAFLAPYIPPHLCPYGVIASLSLPLTSVLGLIYLFLIALGYKSKGPILQFVFGLLIVVLFSGGYRHFLPKDSPGLGDTHIKVMTYNINYFGDAKEVDDITNYILHSDADIICLQEFGITKLSKVLSQAKLLYLLKKKYPYSHVWFKNQFTSLWWGVMTLSRYPLKNKVKVPYTSKYNVSVYCDAVINKHCTLRIINNHLESSHLSAHDISLGEFSPQDLQDENKTEKVKAHYVTLIKKIALAEEIREQQAIQVREVVDASPYPVLIMGDFNSTSFSFAYQKIKGNHKDLRLSTGGSSLFGKTFKGKGISVGIDHILVPKSFHCISCKVDKVTYSDHFPVLGEISFSTTN